MFPCSWVNSQQRVGWLWWNSGGSANGLSFPDLQSLCGPWNRAVVCSSKAKVRRFKECNRVLRLDTFLRFFLVSIICCWTRYASVDDYRTDSMKSGTKTNNTNTCKTLLLSFAHSSFCRQRYGFSFDLRHRRMMKDPMDKFKVKSVSACKVFGTFAIFCIVGFCRHWGSSSVPQLLSGSNDGINEHWLAWRGGSISFWPFWPSNVVNVAATRISTTMHMSSLTMSLCNKCDNNIYNLCAFRFLLSFWGL